MSADVNDLQIVDLGEHFDAVLLDQTYREVYLPAFPLPDEQEHPDIWTPRLKDPNANPRLAFLVAGHALDDPQARQPQALLVAEYYAASRCVLVSYLAVVPEARGQGLAHRLYDALTARLHAGRFGEPGQIAAVLAEIHDPQRIHANDDVIDPAARVEVMARLGARRLPIDYVQPALEPGKQASHDLWLVTFPARASGRARFGPEVLRRFLIEFYQTLGCADPAHDPAFAATFASVRRLAERVAAGLPFHEPLERQVRSCLRVQQAAVAFQYLAADPLDAAVANCPPEAVLCRHFHSCEKDLLSHAFRRPPPMRTYCVPNAHAIDEDPYTLHCEIVFPESLRFESEGEVFTLRRQGPARVEASVSFSRGDFLQSGRGILNLVVHFDLKGDTTLGEYELLSLTKLWCPPDDSEQLLLGAARFECGGIAYSLDELAHTHLFVSAPVPRPRPLGGCLQIVFSETAGRDAAQLVVSETRWGDVSTRELFDALQAPGTTWPEQQVPALRAVACLLQNILDIENVDRNELADMLDGIDAGDSAVTAVHRGMLFSISLNDRLFEDKGATIGISPYLLLPQAALLHNESVLLDAHALLRQTDRINDLIMQATDNPDDAAAQATVDALRGALVKAVRSESLADLPGSPDWLIRGLVGWLWRRYEKARAASREPSRLVSAFVAEIDQALREGTANHAREKLGQWLDRDMLGNVFQYVSERWIFDEGGKDRGLDSLREVLRSNLDNLDARIEDAKSRHGEWFNSNIAVIGLVFTLFQLIPLERSVGLFETQIGVTSGVPGLIVWVGAGTALMLTLLWRRMLALVYMRALGHVARASAATWLNADPVPRT